LKSEFACDFLLPLADSIFYVIASTIATQGDKVGFIGLHRQKKQGDFTDRHKKIVNYLLPHMAQAIRNHDLMHDFDLTKEQCGLMAVGENGKPFYMNELAEMFIKFIRYYGFALL
jgi:hypothetical protein